jgi:hypothetical protein
VQHWDPCAPSRPTSTTCSKAIVQPIRRWHTYARSYMMYMTRFGALRWPGMVTAWFLNALTCSATRSDTVHSCMDLQQGHSSSPPDKAAALPLPPLLPSTKQGAEGSGEGQPSEQGKEDAASRRTPSGGSSGASERNQNKAR